MQDLRDFFSLGTFVLDTNGDGVPDNTQLAICGVTDSFIPIGLIDVTARFGLETSGLSLPIFTSTEHVESWKLEFEHINQNYVECRLNKSDKKVVISGSSESEVSHFLRWLAAKWPHALNQKLPNHQIIKIQSNNDEIRVFDKNDIASEWFKFGQIETEFQNEYKSTFKSLTDLWGTHGFYQANRVGLNDQCNVGFRFQSQPTKLLLEKACQLSARIGLFSTGLQFPLTARKTLPEIQFSIELLNTSEQATLSFSINEKTQTTTILIEGNESAIAQSLYYLTTTKHYAEGGGFGRWEEVVTPEVNEDPLILEKVWEDVGEKSRLLTTFQDWLADVKGGQRAELKAFLSEPPEIRQEMKQIMENMLRDRIQDVLVDVYSAFKPGFHWVEEVILPQLYSVSDEIDQIIFYCKKESGEKGAELPIRWIQELFPVDEFLAKALEIETDQIQFELIDGQENTYNLEVLSSSGKMLLKASFNAPVVGIQYINSGKLAYPTTGFLELTIDGACVKHQLMPTDRERFWQFYSNEVLDVLPDLLPIHEEDRGFQFPLFSRVEVCAQFSEEERKLGVGEERHSSLEALHEDLYFNTLDYFHYLGNEIGRGPMTSPGGVHPFLHSVSGCSPKAHIKVFGWQPSKTFIRETIKLFFTKESTEPISCQIKENGQVKMIPQNEWVEQKNLSVDGLTQKGANVWLGAVSYEGRDIPVIDVFSPTDAELVSTHKLSSYKPTILIETGHHPNEVSSMPAILELINTLDSSLLDKVNLVIIPCANVDGKALHNRLIHDNPEWKHHAARFNSVGLEYALHRYQKTVFGEATVVPKIFDRWVPDVSVDDHGIPSHEWIQPFAGYNSPPRFPVSYWIPNSLIYGIGKVLQGKEFEAHRQLLKNVMDAIVKKISENQDIKKLNEKWGGTYYKYGSKWLPEVFPIEQLEKMIFYKWDTTVNPYSTEMIARYPEWCSIELISETADETVYDVALANCVKAHQLFDLGVIELISQCQRERQQVVENGRLAYSRKRPLVLQPVVV